MSKGFLILTRNTPTVNYMEQAYALALSIKASQLTVRNVSLVTDDEVPEHYKAVFDHIIPIENGTENTRFQADARWRLFHVTPYEETMVLDADMLLLNDISYWWKYAERFELLFCSKIINYSLEPVPVDTIYRKAFVNNKLSNPYFGLHYFKKRAVALEFYKQLKFVVRNWRACCEHFAPNNYQSTASMDLASAIAIKLLAIQDDVFDELNPMVFTHMKPAIQGWYPVPALWKSVLSYNLNNNGELLVANIKQPGLFHYVEKDFLTPDIVTQLEKLANDNILRIL